MRQERNDKMLQPYDWPSNEDNCLNRLIGLLSSLGNLTNVEEKFRTLLYGAIELRYAIEGTVRHCAYRLGGKPLRSFTRQWRTKTLKQILENHDSQFFSKMHVWVLIGKCDLQKDIIEPDFDRLNKVGGESGGFLHAPHKDKFQSQEEFLEWMAGFEKCLLDGSHYMFEVFGRIEPKMKLHSYVLNDRGQWLVNQYHSGEMDDDQIVKYLKERDLKTSS